MLFSISTANRLLATFGIAIMNGVVLAIYIRDLKASGLGARDAATHAAAMPLPPMIMMAQVAARGFLPMARSTRTFRGVGTTGSPVDMSQAITICCGPRAARTRMRKPG